MPDAFTAILGVLGLTGGAVAWLNYRKAVLWKRAELANNYLKDFNNNPELVFAGRCLDWNGGKLVLPENLRPYMPNGEQFIQHDRHVFAQALRPDLRIHEMEDDPRVQIYRTSVDSFLSWLSLIASALDRKLFLVADLQDVGYWVAKIQSEVVVHGFIVAYGYQENIEKLNRLYRGKKSPYQNFVFPMNTTAVEQIVGRVNSDVGHSRSSTVESKDQREILVALLKEHYNQVRHYETQRSAVSNLIVIIAAAILAFVTRDNVLTTGDLPLASLLVFVGAFGIAFVAKYYERTKANVDRYYAYRDKLEQVFFDPNELKAVFEEAQAVTKNALPRLAEGGPLAWIKTHRLWITFHAIIAIIGLGLIARIVYKMF